MELRLYFCGALIMGAVTGCQTQLQVAPVNANNTSPALGFNYSLPFVQYDIVISRRLSCGEPGGVRLAKVTTAVTATPVFSRDPSQTYAIDYTSLSSWAKISDFKLERHSNGMLKTIGASSEDRTAQILTNIATTAIKVATTAASLGAFPVAVSTKSGTPEPPPPPPPQPICKQAAAAAVDALDAERRSLNAAKSALALESGRMTALVGAMTGSGAKPDAFTQAALREQAIRLVNSQVALNAATKKYENALTKIVEGQALTWPQHGGELSSRTANVMTGDTIGKWFVSSSADDAIYFELMRAPDTTKVTVPDLEPVAATTFRATVSAPPEATAGTAVSGVRYREPARGQLFACYNSHCASAGHADRNLVNDGPVPQLGRLYYLPFTNGIFQNNVLSASFAEDGSLLTAGYAEKSSRGEIATDTMKQIASALPGAIKDIRSARNDQVNAETERLKAQTTNALAQAEYKKALAALTPSPTESIDKEKALIQADTTLKDAYRANIEAKLALEKARAAANAAP
jgi:hypothetical protein